MVGGERPQGVRLNLRSFNVLFQVQYSGLKRDRGEFYTEERTYGICQLQDRGAGHM